jgi:hypothetical protein
MSQPFRSQSEAIDSYLHVKADFDDISARLGETAALLDEAAHGLVTDPASVTIDEPTWATASQIRDLVSIWRSAQQQANAAWLALSDKDRARVGPQPLSASIDRLAPVI